MMRRWLVLIAMLFAAVPLAARAQSLAAPQRIVAVGDLHGDYAAWIDIARDARLIDAKNKWIGGRSVLVQTGDITDRGPDSLKIIRHLQKLDGEAKRAGGRVIVLLGNHEAMQVTGDYRYVTPGEYAAFADRQSAKRRDAAFDANAKAIIAFYHQRDPSLSPKAIRDEWISTNPLGKVEYVAAWSPTGELGRWAASLPAVAKIGDTIFVHGGISAKYALVPIAEINRRARAALLAGDASDEAIINDQMGPLWYRGLVTRAGEPAAGSTDDGSRAGRVLARSRGQANGDRPHARHQGRRLPLRRQADPDRYRYFALLRGQAGLAGNHRRAGRSPMPRHGASNRGRDMMRGFILALAVLGGAPALAAEPVKALFASDEVIRITIQGPVDTIAKAPEEVAPGLPRNGDGRGNGGGAAGAIGRSAGSRGARAMSASSRRCV